jgi:Fic family protein
MRKIGSARSSAIESVQRIEPTHLEDPSREIVDLVSELSAEAAVLGQRLHPDTAANLAALVRIMNAYYSNLIEGHNTRPADIERALAGEFDEDRERRNLQLEAAGHVRVQAEIDRMAAERRIGEPASTEFIRWLHREFYKDVSADLLEVRGVGRAIAMTPGEWRAGPEQEVVVGRHLPPSSNRVPDFMNYFEERYRFGSLGKASRIMAIAAAHHRLNCVHPFPDGNGRVSRLMSHAMAHEAGIGAHGLWSISRGLARGLDSRSDYKRMMDHADMPRQGDRDGRGNLSRRALADFVLWFLKVSLDQVRFMSGLFDLDTLAGRMRNYVAQSDRLKPEASRLLEETLMRGSIARGDAPRLTGLPERTARRVVNDVIAEGLLFSSTPKGDLALRFPAATLDTLFPKLFPHA